MYTPHSHPNWPWHAAHAFLDRQEVAVSAFSQVCMPPVCHQLTHQVVGVLRNTADQVGTDPVLAYCSINTYYTGVRHTAYNKLIPLLCLFTVTWTVV